MPSETLIQKITDLHAPIKIPLGTMVAIKRPDGIHLGVALCSKKDRYNHSLGLKIAKGRAAKEGSICLGRRQTGTVVPQLEAFVARAKRYFQTEEVTFSYWHPELRGINYVIS